MSSSTESIKVYLRQGAGSGAVHPAQTPGYRLHGRSRCLPHCRRPQALQTAPAAQWEGQSAIDIQNNIKAQQSAGYKHWVTIENLKRAAATMNFLTEHGIGSYEELEERCDAIAAASIRTRESLRDTEQRIADFCPPWKADRHLPQTKTRL